MTLYGILCLFLLLVLFILFCSIIFAVCITLFLFFSLEIFNANIFDPLQIDILISVLSSVFASIIVFIIGSYVKSLLDTKWVDNSRKKIIIFSLKLRNKISQF